LNDKIILISDFFIDDFIGGAALNDEEIYKLLSKRFDVFKIKSRYLYEGFIRENLDSFFIISNFFGVDLALRDLIQSKCKYILYCHDYKFVAHTNPAAYPDFLVPPNELINVNFHRDAHKIICQTRFQKDIYDKNIHRPLKTVNFSGNLWSKEQLELLGALAGTEKNDKCAIIDSKYPQKGVEESTQYCKDHDLGYDIIGDSDYSKFLEILSSYSTLVFHPSTPETCCRVALEAKMMGLKVITNDLVGASYEEWYNLNGADLINKMRQKRKGFADFISKIRRDD
tara:strand:- start:258 stop:1109 length:852 start_codon:yes stop_codon:yes gene_type:complete